MRCVDASQPGLHTSTVLGLTVLVSDSLLSLPRCCLRSRSPSCLPSRRTMENSRLPIEVCERVIDECFYFDWRPDRNETLRACALTCSAWLPRSRYNLYHELRVRDSKSAGSIVDTLTARSELAEHVRVIDVWLGSYASLTQVLSLPLLKKCQRLEININWDNFPPRYVQNCLVPLLTKFESVVELNFTAWSAASAVDFFHIIWAMPQLLSCKLEYAEQWTPTAASLANLERTALRMQPRLCLQTLVFFNYSDVSSQYLSLFAFLTHSLA